MLAFHKVVDGDAHKGHILRIGRFDERGFPAGDWAFNGEDCDAAGLRVLEDGTVLYCGWTVPELREIAQKAES